MLSGLLPLLRESPPYARIRGAVQERRPMWVQGPAGAEKAYLLGALLADPEVAVETTVIVLPGRDAVAEWRALLERLVMGAPTIALLPVSGLLRRLPSAEQLRVERHQIRGGERLERDTFPALVAAHG